MKSTGTRKGNLPRRIQFAKMSKRGIWRNSQTLCYKARTLQSEYCVDVVNILGTKTCKTFARH